MLTVPRATVTVGLLLNSAIAFSAEKLDLIPSEFQGNWASDIKHCKIDHDLNLEIGSTFLNYWESSGSVLSVVKHGERKLALLVDFSGEGDEWVGFVHFQISASGTKLTDIRDSNSKVQLVRHRCQD